MYIKLLHTALLFLAFLNLSNAQNGDDPALFTIDGKPVYTSEFKYIYAKTNQQSADFSEKSLRDYLELYTDFKLKVRKARDLQLDTVASTNAELDGYRRQLAKSYLEDKEVTDKLVREAYERMQYDVDISHIFVACDRNAKPADTLRAFKRAQAWMAKVKLGTPFELVAADSSEDKSAKENRGNLGFITAMLPDGYYGIEKAVYDAKNGEMVGPVRSNGGYHILRVNGRRAARGEIEVGQILFRKSADNPEKNAQLKLRADSVASALMNGSAKWDEACTKFSDDKATISKQGYLGFFGINRYAKAFEDAAFSIEKDGSVSPAVETTIGYHIIRRISQRGTGVFESARKGIAERVKRDGRSELARQSIISRIQREGNYKTYPENLNAWTAKQVDSVFLTFRWRPDSTLPKTPLMQYGSSDVYTVADFEDYCAKASRERMRGAGYPKEETIQKLYKSWADDVALLFEEGQLDKKYPEFRSLMREYEEGILLFEALKINVWDRANTDSVGLEKFYTETLKDKYKWDERARVSLYTLKTDDPKTIEKLRKLAAKKPSADVLKKMNKKTEVVTVFEKLYEKGKNRELGSLWAAGAMTEAKTDAGTKTATFYKIEELTPPTAKKLSEARGYAVADYQDYLDKQWVKELRSTYKVDVNEKALKALVKK